MGPPHRLDIRIWAQGSVQWCSHRWWWWWWWQNPILDYPLVYMDASTFRPEQQVRFEQEFSHKTPNGVECVKNLAAHGHYNSEQRWCAAACPTRHSKLYALTTPRTCAQVLSQRDDDQ